MLIYFGLIIFWAFFYLLLKDYSKHNNKGNWKIFYCIGSGLALLTVMGLRHPSVGTDTNQYIFKLNLIYNDFHNEYKLIENSEWGYELLNILLNMIGVTNQAFLLIIAFIISLSFSLFYFKFSKNMFLSMYLHLTIGLFAMSMSGIRQTIAICFILLAFHYTVKGNFFKFITSVFLAYIFHNSAIVFFFVYFLRKIKVTRNRAIILLTVVTSSILFRKSFTPIIEFIMPERYIGRYELFSQTNLVNPMLIVIAIAVPTACLIFWRNIEMLGEKELQLFSILFIMSCINILMNILSLDSNMIGRVSFYFLVFNTVLIPNVISQIQDKRIRFFGYYFGIVLPLIQFVRSTPGGTYQIDHYKFFWQ